MTFTIRRASHDDKPEWLRMRHGLWPEAPLDYLARDLDDLLADEDTAVFMAFNENAQPVGFIEVSLRSFAEGCETSPVGYIEAWYVAPDARRRRSPPGRSRLQTAPRRPDRRWRRPAP